MWRAKSRPTWRSHVCRILRHLAFAQPLLKLMASAIITSEQVSSHRRRCISMSFTTSLLRHSSPTRAPQFVIEALLPEAMSPAPCRGMEVSRPDQTHSISPPFEFPYTPLKEGSIRLVHFLPTSTPCNIRCSLEYRHTLDQHQTSKPYKALSYCWGDQNLTKLITLDGRPFRVTKNLWRALSAIVEFHGTPQPLWIDAICINQADLHERNHQVKHMWRIFSGAEHVYAWLGPQDEETDFAWSTMRRLAKGCQANTTESGQCSKLSKGHRKVSRWAIQAVYQLCAREYFTRAWTVVEIMNARQISLVCGKYIIETSVFLHAIGALVDQGTAHHISFPAQHHTIWRSRKLTARTSAGQDLSAQQAHQYFPEIFSIFSGSQCSDPRDKVFAMISAARLRNSRYPLDVLGPDYSWTIDELVLIVLEFYTRLAEAALAEKPDDRDNPLIVLELLHIAFGTPVTPPDFCTWFRSHADWMETWHVDATVATCTGRKVACFGPVWDYLLDERNTRSVLPFYARPPGHRINVTTGFV